MLFGKCGPSVRELGVLVNRPLTNFKKAGEKVCEHFYGASKSTSASRGRRFHQSAVEDATMFLKGMENQSSQIDWHYRESAKKIALLLWRQSSSVEGKQLLSQVITMMHLQYKRIQQQIMETSWLRCSSAFRQVIMK